MAGLVPAIHRQTNCFEKMDHRGKPRDDDGVCSGGVR